MIAVRVGVTLTNTSDPDADVLTDSQTHTPYVGWTSVGAVTVSGIADVQTEVEAEADTLWPGNAGA